MLQLLYTHAIYNSKTSRAPPVKMPTETENVQYLYLVLTHGGTPTVSIYAKLSDSSILTASADRLGRCRRRHVPQERRRVEALVAPEEVHGRRRDTIRLRLQVSLAVRQAHYSRQSKYTPPLKTLVLTHTGPRLERNRKAVRHHAWRCVKTLLAHEASFRSW